MIVNVKGCGFFFPLPVPPDEVLCAMKLSALLARGKGRDFYDAMFLLAQTRPDYEFLKARCGIGWPEELKTAIGVFLATTDLNVKKRDFEHLLFNKQNADKILRFGAFVDSI
ncbi:nucleotidyl transferase AbiEii/AbiGii toxin family protein [Alistipes sp.]|uniref:nucleotidyl transferase AbiEii/AbiGii toxin family protein n=1 Tax=Alistipes sp. TaxID=1872444 RepID=UPI003AEF8E5C